MTPYQVYQKSVRRWTLRSLSAMPRIRMVGVQADHVVPVSVCWKYKVPPEKAGSPANIRFITTKANLEQAAALDEDARKKLRDWGYL